MPLAQHSASTVRRPAARVYAPRSKVLPLDAESPKQPHLGLVGAPPASPCLSTHIPQEAPGNALQDALPKLECPSDSGGWRRFSSECGNQCAPIRAEGAEIDFVKSSAINVLDRFLAQISEHTPMKTLKKRINLTPTTEKPLSIKINEIGQNGGARRKLECPLASTNRGLGPKLRVHCLFNSKLRRLSRVESSAYTVFGANSIPPEMNNCVDPNSSGTERPIAIPGPGAPLDARMAICYTGEPL